MDPDAARGGATRPLVILAHGDGWPIRFGASSLAASSVAAGQPVELVLFFAALAAWVGDRWDDPEPGAPRRADGSAAPDLPSLTGLLAPARERGLLRLYACSASAHLLGLDPAAVQARVDVLAGWPTFHRRIRGAEWVVSL